MTITQVTQGSGPFTFPDWAFDASMLAFISLFIKLFLKKEKFLLLTGEIVENVNPLLINHI